MSPTLRWSLLVAGEAALVLFLLTWGLTFTGSIPLHRIQLVILAVLGGIGWLVILTRPSRLPALLVAAPLPLLAALTLTSLASPYPSLSWFATWQCAAYVGIGWLLAMQASHPAGRRNLVAAMGIVVVIVLGVYLVQIAAAWADWLALGFPVASLPLRPLYGGGLAQIPAWLVDVVLLCAPVVVVSLWVARMRVAAVVLAVAGAVTIVLSGTRSVLLLVVVLGVLGTVLIVRDRGGRRVALLASLAAAVVVIVALPVVLLASRSFDAGRSSLWASAVAGFVSSPVVGTGPGTYAVGRMDDTVDALSRLAHPDANNAILTMSSDSGLVGLIGLGLAAVAYVVAMRTAWRLDPLGRPVAAANLLSLALFAGHAMVEMVFALIGVVMLFLAGISLASTTGLAANASAGRRSRWLDSALAAGLVVIVVSSIVIGRTEMTLDAVAEAEASLPTSPGAAHAAARRATERSPDSVPGWWVRMVAADAVGDATDAVASARRVVDLEGFSQEWITLATLLRRAGDAAGARDATDRATAHPPVDPFVQLNAAIQYEATGATERAEEAVRLLYAVQPDIEPVLADGPSGLAAMAARVRPSAASALMEAGQHDLAMLVALSGEDRELATTLVSDASLASAPDAYWRTVIAAWFGDPSARTAHDAAAAADPQPAAFDWSWRLAARACDTEATAGWERAVEIAVGRHPAAPTALGVAPGFQVRLFPVRYPGVVWRMDHPQWAYVTGIWTYTLGRPDCAEVMGG